MVENCQVLGAEKRAFRHGRRGALRHRQPFEVPGGLVAKVADGSAVESGDAYDRCRLLACHRGQRIEGIAVAEVERPRLEADERVAGQALATLDAFEQESRL